MFLFFFKQKTAYEMRISDWSSDVCSSDLDIPQDHAFIATLYRFAAKHNIKYILNGFNYSTECVRNPLEWIYHGSDMRQFWDIQKKFGTRSLKNYPISSRSEERRVGKECVVRVDLGGGRIIKKTTKNKQTSRNIT